MCLDPVLGHSQQLCAVPLALANLFLMLMSASSSRVIQQILLII